MGLSDGGFRVYTGLLLGVQRWALGPETGAVLERLSSTRLKRKLVL